MSALLALTAGQRLLVAGAVISVVLNVLTAGVLIYLTGARDERRNRDAREGRDA